MQCIRSLTVWIRFSCNIPLKLNWQSRSKMICLWSCFDLKNPEIFVEGDSTLSGRLCFFTANPLEHSWRYSAVVVIPWCRRYFQFLLLIPLNCSWYLPISQDKTELLYQIGFIWNCLWYASNASFTVFTCNTFIWSCWSCKSHSPPVGIPWQTSSQPFLDVFVLTAKFFPGWIK